MGKELQIRSIALPLGSLDAYINWTSQIPILSAEEEQELANQFHQHGDLEAARKLVLSHLRFVVYVSRKYLGYGLSQADLIQEGSIGLMKAVKRFDPKMGVRLTTFAIHWIKAEIHEFVLRNWRIVKIATTKAQRKLFFNLRKFSKKTGWLCNSDVQHISKTLNVSEKEVQNMEARLNCMDESFDGYKDDEENSNSLSPANYLEDQKDSPEFLNENIDYSKSREQNLSTALGTLCARDKDIITTRWLANKKTTLHQLAKKYNISAERVRQLESQAMNKLKKSMGHF